MIGFDEMDMTVDEDAGTINVPVTLAQEIAVPVTVDFMIVSGTAMEGPLNGQYIYYHHSKLCTVSVSCMYCVALQNTHMD